MALIKCPECGKEISDKAKACPECGYKMKKSKKKFIPILIFVLLVVACVGGTLYYKTEIALNANEKAALMMINEIKGTNTKDKITIRKLMAKDSGERKWIYVDYSIPSLDDIALGVVKDNKLEKTEYQMSYEWGRAVGNATLTVQTADVGFAQNEVEHNDSKWKEINIKKVMKKIK